MINRQPPVTVASHISCLVFIHCQSLVSEAWTSVPFAIVFSCVLCVCRVSVLHHQRQATFNTFSSLTTSLVHNRQQQHKLGAIYQACHLCILLEHQFNGCSRALVLHNLCIKSVMDTFFLWLCTYRECCFYYWLASSHLPYHMCILVGSFRTGCCPTCFYFFHDPILWGGYRLSRIWSDTILVTLHCE